METNKGREICAGFSAFASTRHILETYWEDAYRYSMPHRGQQFLKRHNDPYTDSNNAQDDQSSIFDPTATEAVELLSNSIISGITPSNAQWFGLEVDSEEEAPHDVKAWLQTSSQKLFKAIHSSNYNAEAFEFFQDIAIAGMAGLYIDKEPGGDYRFEIWPLGSLFVGETKKGKIDIVYRMIRMTATQAVKEFGINNVPESIKAAYGQDAKTGKTFEIIHCIRPRKGKGKGPLNTQMPFESVYVCKATNMVLKESGYHEFPVVIPRWQSIPDTPYALGPLNAALPDVKTVNRVVEMMLSNAEMAISGTYVATHDGILNPSTIRIGPRRVIFAADPNNIRPLQAAGEFRIAFEEITRLQTQIKAMMMADQLAPIQKDYASATEVTQRAQIIRQILGPMYARLQSEFLQPLIDRVFGLAMRDGSLGEIPQWLEGKTLIPAYMSPLARAQKMEQIAAMDQYETALANIAQIDPDVMDLYDRDAAYRLRADLLGVPADVINSEDKVKQKRKQQAQAEEQQAMMQAQAGQPPVA